MVFDPSSSAVTAYRLGRSGGLFGALSGQIRARGSGSQRSACHHLRSTRGVPISEPDLIPGQSAPEASLRLEGLDVVAQPGQVGRELKMEATLIYLGAQLQTFSDGEVPLVVQEVQPQVLDVSAQADVARRILSQPLTLVDSGRRRGRSGSVYRITRSPCESCSAWTAHHNGVEVVLEPDGCARCWYLSRIAVTACPRMRNSSSMMTPASWT
jgi:hypothetical protein